MLAAHSSHAEKWLDGSVTPPPSADIERRASTLSSASKGRIDEACDMPSEPPPARCRIPMTQDRQRDFLILIVVVLAIVLGAELIIRFQAWDRLQACFSLGRSNCVPPIFLKDIY